LTTKLHLDGFTILTLSIVYIHDMNTPILAHVGFI
jgi:hypothetical protein